MESTSSMCRFPIYAWPANYCFMITKRLEKYLNIPLNQDIVGSTLNRLVAKTTISGNNVGILWHANAAKYVNCLHASVLWTVSSVSCKQMKTWMKMKIMLIYHEWRSWMITLKITIQTEMLIFIGSIVSISYAKKSHNLHLSPWDSQSIKFQMNCCNYVQTLRNQNFVEYKWFSFWKDTPYQKIDNLVAICKFTI